MDDYISINKESWDKRTEKHVNSEFYNNAAFIQMPASLNSIELSLLGELKGKSVLHLQCHFGQDSISLEKLGAKVTAVDFSEKAIKEGKKLALKTNSSVNFICSDIYALPKILNEKFDIVFTSYGTIGWLPDIDKWANIIQYYLKPEGCFVFAEFHPVIWMFDNEFEKVVYRYFNSEAIIENESTYADDEKSESFQSITWNHGIAEVLTSLLNKGLKLHKFKEFDYSPYNCLAGMVEFEQGKFRIAKMGDRLPMVYALKMFNQA